MEINLVDYIKTTRKSGAPDEDIKHNLIAFGWPAEQVEAAMKANLDLPTPPPPPSPPSVSDTSPIVTTNVMPTHSGPIAVVQSPSTRGLEYTIMFLALWVTATSFGWLVHNGVDGLFGVGGDSSVYGAGVSYAASAILVALPIFAVLFLRLKHAEQADSELKLDASRRKAIQLTLVVTFLIGVFNIIGYVYGLLNNTTGTGVTYSGSSENPFANLLHTLVTLAIAGGIFAYYWIDQHRAQ